MKTILCGIAMGAAIFVPAALAADHSHHAHPVAAAATPAMAEGTVKKIDKARAMVTLAHGPIASVGMPAMTMAFKLRNASAADSLKVGDKVRFAAEQVGGEIVIVSLESAK